jgi:hypothetical protein
VRVTATSGGRPLAFAPLNLEAEGVGGLQATTDKDGVATFTLPQANATMRLAVRYGGSAGHGTAAVLSSLVPLAPPSLLETGARIGGWLAGAAAVALIAAAWFVRRLRRHPLDAALRRARQAIRGRGAHETQVLQAYRVLEDAAIAHEILEAPAATPRELQRAIGATLAPGLHPPLDRLITLFEQARYGLVPMDSSHRDQALAALDALRRELSRMDPFWATATPSPATNSVAAAAPAARATPAASAASAVSAASAAPSAPAKRPARPPVAPRRGGRVS